MAKTGTLLNTDLEVLFSQRSIEDIEKLSQGLKHDIDHKREELRTMVGERYRDLMEAADTIAHMKTSSESVIYTMKSIIRTTNDLQSVSFSKADYLDNRNMAADDVEAIQPASNDDEFFDDRMVALAAQIKLLTDSPEKMWSAVEQSDYLMAAQLYLFARHIHTSLTMHDMDGQLSAGFPVIDRQWNAIAHFHESILEGCQKAIASSSTPPDKSVEAMASMVCLRGITSNSLLEEFLKLREASLKDFLKSQKSQSAKSYIGQTLISIVSFLSTVHKAFVPQQEEWCELEHLLQGLSSTPTLSLYQSTGFSAFSSPVMKHLPQIVRDFCPSLVSVDSTTKAKQQISRDHVTKACTQWLDRVHDDISENTSAILEHVNTIPALSKIRKAIYDRMKGDLAGYDWDRLCLDTLSRKIILWNEFYRNLFLDRVELLIESRMKESIELVLNDINDWRTNPDSKEDTFKFIWSEAGLNDMAGVKSANETPNILTMKTKAYSPAIQSTCYKLNKSLQHLMQELMEYVNVDKDNGKGQPAAKDPLAFLKDDPAKDPLKAEPFSLTLDNETILKFSQRTCIDSVQHLVKEISLGQTTNPIDLGRLLQAMTELCPSIQKCIDSTSISEKNKLDGRGMSFQRGSPEWTEVKNLLETESNRYYTLWIGKLVSGLKTNLTNYLTDNASLHLLAEWEVAEIAEEGEDGNEVRSVIRVPQYVSIGLHSALAAFVRQIHMIGPHALPSQIQLELSQSAADAVVQSCLKFSDSQKLMQNLSLQLYFDVQFVLQSMVSRDNKSLTSLCSSALASLERHIDPFDLSVFSPYISENVKKAVIRGQTIFGTLIPSDRFSILASMKASVGSGGTSDQQHSQQHNVIRMSSVNFRFPLLPVSSASTGPGQQRRGRPRDTPAQASTTSRSALTVQPSSQSSTNRKRSKSPTTKSAASFFGSMSTNWFGGK